MSIERKLVFSCLREDDVQRAFFSVRPMVATDGTDFSQDAVSLWPDNGFLRIVPDRREQHYFKERLRRLGGYCLINLLYHQEMSGKIRTNKNYSPERGEENRSIIYSDVILALNERSFFEAVPGKAADFAALAEQAITPMFYILDGEQLYGPVNKGLPALPETAAPLEAQFHTFTALDGTTHHLLIPLNQEGAVPEPRTAVPEPRPAAAQPTQPPAPRPQPGTKPDRPEPQAKPELQEPAEPRFAQPAQKNKAQAFISSQAREGRRIQQAEPLPDNIVMTELENPVETAIQAFTAAWAYPRARDQLLAAVLALPDVRERLDAFMLANNAPVHALTEVAERRWAAAETRRLHALVDMERVQRDAVDARERLYRSLSAKKRSELEQLDRQLHSRRPHRKESEAGQPSPVSLAGAARALRSELGGVNPEIWDEALALAAMLPERAAALPEDTVNETALQEEDVRQVLAPIVACLTEPEREPLLSRMTAFVITVSDGMTGGLATACDWAMQLMLVPALRGCAARPEAELLAAFPLTKAAVAALPQAEEPQAGEEEA